MEKWKDITQYSSAILAMGSGILLSFIQFFDQGDLSNGVLYYVSQMLLYAGAIFGVTTYYRSKYGDIKKAISKHAEEINDINDRLSKEEDKQYS